MKKTVVACCALLILASVGGCGKRSSRSRGAVRATDTSVAQPPGSVLPLQAPVLFAAGETVDLLTGGVRGASNKLLRYDPSGNVWKVLAAPPFDPPLFLPQVVWTGAVVVAVGTPCARVDGPTTENDDFECSPGGLAAAVYDPSTDAWSPAPQPPGGAPATGSGPFHRSIGWDGTHALFIVGESLVAYDPPRNSWSTRTSATELQTARDWCVAGEHVVALSSTTVSGAFVDPTVYETRASGDVVALPALPDTAKSSYDYYLTCSPPQLVVFTAKLDKIWRFDFARAAWAVAPGVDTVLAPWNNRYWTGTDLVLWDALSTQAWSISDDGRVARRPEPPRVRSDATAWTGTQFAALLSDGDRFVLFPSPGAAAVGR